MNIDIVLLKFQKFCLKKYFKCCIFWKKKPNSTSPLLHIHSHSNLVPMLDLLDICHWKSILIELVVVVIVAVIVVVVVVVVSISRVYFRFNEAFFYLASFWNFCQWHHHVSSSQKAPRTTRGPWQRPLQEGPEAFPFKQCRRQQPDFQAELIRTFWSAQSCSDSARPETRIARFDFLSKK